MGDLADYLVQHDPNFRRARLPALYSDFRSQRTLNPDGFQANVNAWQNALSTAVWNGQVPSRAGASDLLAVKVDESLARALDNKQFGRPLALGTVVKEAVVGRELVPLQDFLKAKESIFNRSWTQLPWNVVTWTLQKIWASDGATGEDRLPNGRFVVIKNTEEAAKLLDQRLGAKSSRFDRVFSKTHFEKTFADTLVQGRRLSETDLDVLIKFMARDKNLVVFDGKTIKIKGVGASESLITEEDTAIASLKEFVEDLQHQTGLLSARVDELTLAAKDAVARKNKVLAMASIKSKKVAESLLEKRFQTLNQLEQVAGKIEQAADQVALVRAMESSTGVLRSLNAQVGGADRVDEVVSLLREQMVEVDEVGQVLADGTAESAAVDEAEIDDALAALERDERQREEEAEKARRETEAAKEAEETRRRLEVLGETPSGLGVPATEDAGRQSPATETAEVLGRMELEEQPQPQAAT